MRKTRLISLLLVLAGWLSSGLCPAAAADGGVSAGPVAEKPLVGVDEQFNVAVEVRNVNGLMGTTFELSFDPGLLEVMDADPATNGAQVADGNIFAGKSGLMIVVNETDNQAGTVKYSALVTKPASAFTGAAGTIAVIKFKAKAPGSAEIKFNAGSLSAPGGLELSGMGGDRIPAGLFAAAVTIAGTPPPPPPPPAVATAGPVAEKEEVGTGEQFNVAVQVTNVAGLMGTTFELCFDPLLLEVMDADPATGGTQIAGGNIFAGKSGLMLLVNEADNQAGTVKFSSLVTDPASAFTGAGTLAVIHFKALAEGDAVIKLKAGSLLAPGGIALSVYGGGEHPAETFAAAVKISGKPFINGRVLLEKVDPQAPGDNSGVTVSLKKGAELAAAVTTAGDGAYSFGDVAPGVYDIEYFKAGYSKAVCAGVAVAAGANNLPDLTLLLGDMNGDTYINVQDLLWMAGCIGKRPGDPQWAQAGLADVNRDTYINVFDLLRVAVNLGKKPQ